MIKLLDLLAEKSPCWKGYEQIGMKDKDGRQVPNCVPIKNEAFFIGEDDINIECEKCGWKWELEDGGKDPYICHKCGFDNSYRYIDSIDEYDVENEQDLKEFIVFIKELYNDIIVIYVSNFVRLSVDEVKDVRLSICFCEHAY